MSNSAPPGGLTRAEVEHVARLARLALTDNEIDQFSADLGAVLSHAQDVAALDIANVAQTTRPLPLVNVFRADTITPSLNREEVLRMAPSAESDRFKVPQILGDAP